MTLSLRRKRLDLVEALLVCVVAWLCGVVVGSWFPALHSERTALADAYANKKISEHEEEWVVRDFFRDERDGVFVDVGANDYRRFSNTYYLETQLGWGGIAIDAQRKFAENYRRYRPRTRFLCFFVSDISNAAQRLYVLDKNPLVASERREFTQRWGTDTTSVDVPTITLTDLLDRERASRVDFLSMDIELAEPKALRGFDIDRFRPRLACVEAHPEVRQQILNYFAQHRYVVMGKYLRADTHNLYFAPLP